MSLRLLAAADLAPPSRRATLREHGESQPEGEFARANAPRTLSVDALVGSLENVEGLGQLRRDLAARDKPSGLPRRVAARAQLDAPHLELLVTHAFMHAPEVRCTTAGGHSTRVRNQ